MFGGVCEREVLMMYLKYNVGTIREREMLGMCVKEKVGDGFVR